MSLWIGKWTILVQLKTGHRVYWSVIYNTDPSNLVSSRESDIFQRFPTQKYRFRSNMAPIFTGGLIARDNLRRQRGYDFNGNSDKLSIWISLRDSHRDFTRKIKRYIPVTFWKTVLDIIFSLVWPKWAKHMIIGLCIFILALGLASIWLKYPRLIGVCIGISLFIIICIVTLGKELSSVVQTGWAGR